MNLILSATIINYVRNINDKIIRVKLGYMLY